MPAARRQFGWRDLRRIEREEVLAEARARLAGARRPVPSSWGWRAGCLDAVAPVPLRVLHESLARKSAAALRMAGRA